MNYSESGAIVEELLKIRSDTMGETMRLQLIEIKKIECEKRQAHVRELMRLHYGRVKNGYAKW